MSKTIFLDVQVPVYFEVCLSLDPVSTFKCFTYLFARQVGSNNRTAIVKQDATLVCNAFGDQPISIIWRKVEIEDSFNVNDNGIFHFRGAGRFTATPRGFPSSKPIPPLA